jgi:hypothetical protein
MVVSGLIDEDFYDEIDRDFIIEMDGMEHDCPTHITGCCKQFGKPCCATEGCHGWMHYEPIYGGYYYQCEVCHTTSI